MDTPITNRYTHGSAHQTNQFINFSTHYPIRSECDNHKEFDCAKKASKKKKCKENVPKTDKTVKFFCPENCKSKCSMDTSTDLPMKTPTEPTNLLTQAPTNPICGECENHKEFDCTKKASKKKKCKEMYQTLIRL